MKCAERVLRFVLRAVTVRPLLTVLLSFALSALAVAYTIGNMQFITNRKDLINSDPHSSKIFRQRERFLDLDSFIVVIENRDTARSLEFLETLTRQLKGDRQHFPEVFSRVDRNAFSTWGLYFLDEEELKSLHDSLSEHQDFILSLAQSPNLENFFDQLNHNVTSRIINKAFTGFLDPDDFPGAKSPLQLDFVIRVLEGLGSWLNGSKFFDPPWESIFLKSSQRPDHEDQGYFWTTGHKYLLAFVTPSEENERFTKSRESLLALRKAIASVQTSFPEIRAGVTGRDALNMDEMGGAFRDMGVATVISVVALTLLLIAFWRGIKRPLLEITELLVALSWTFGLTTLFIGHLNILSVTFAPLLLGLGIDYGIHWFSRYQEEVQYSNASKRQAIETAMVTLGPSILLAGGTAALSFFPLVLTGFKGLAELGIITSIGMVMTTLSTLCLLPALTLVFDRGGPSTGPIRGRVPMFRISGIWAPLLVVVAGITLLLSLRAVWDESFDLNMLRLQARQAEAVVWEKKLIETTQRSSLHALVYSDSPADIRKKVTALKALPTVSQVRSVESLIPSDQERKSVLLQTMRPLLPPVSLALEQPSPRRAKLDETLGRIRFKMLEPEDSPKGLDEKLKRQRRRVRDLIDAVRGHLQKMPDSEATGALLSFQEVFFSDLKEKLDLLETRVNALPMKIEDLPDSLLKRFVSKDKKSYLIMVFPSRNVWEPEQLGRFVSDLRSVDPDVAGNSVTLYDFTGAFRNACVRAVEYALVFVFLLLLVTLRHPADALMALLPLILGTLWTFGLMHIFGVSLNLANSLFLPLVVGAGVEYGIVILQRWKEQGIGNRDGRLPFSTWKGILLAGLTTTVGFGSLVIADHQGIHSLGMLATFGSLSTLAAALFFLPAFRYVLPKSSARRLFFRS